MLFQHLSPERETEFRKWARNNYRKFEPISGVWHPVVQDECRKINEESGYAPNDYPDHGTARTNGGNDWRGKMSLTEDTIERRIERHIDHIDRLFLSGAIDQETYDKCISDIHKRAEAQYAAMARCK